MFTISDIKAAHAKVKSGADFPAYIQDLKALGVQRYEHFVADGHTSYSGKDGFEASSPAAYAVQDIAATGSAAMLQTALSIHQQGQTNYLTFCQQAAGAGVRNGWWI